MKQLLIGLSLIGLMASFAKADEVGYSLQVQRSANYFKTLEEDLDWFQAASNKLGVDDTRGLFLRIYQTVTLEMPNMFQEHQFQNPEWVHALMLKYVSLYRNSLDCSLLENCELSPAWNLAFKENAREKYQPTVQLLLSISAHVNRDLPIALAEIGTDFNDESKHKDFQQIALIFQRRMSELLIVVSDYERCHVNHADRKFIDKIINFAMSSTREQSWEYGRRLSQVGSSVEEKTLLAEIEAHTDHEDYLIKKYAPIPEKLVCF